MAEEEALGWEEGLRSSFTTKISMLLNQTEQDELRQKRHLPAVIFVFIFFSRVALPKAGNGFMDFHLLPAVKIMCTGEQSQQSLCFP